MTDKAELQPSKRVDQHAAMLDEALRRPGVREVMEVYGAWQRIDKQLGTYRAATTPVPTVTTTDQANNEVADTGWIADAILERDTRGAHESGRGSLRGGEVAPCPSV